MNIIKPKPFVNTNIKTIEAKVSIISKTRCEINVSYDKKAIEFIKSLDSSGYDHNTRTWSVSLSKYHLLISGLLNLGHLKVMGIPSCITKMFSHQINGKALPLNPITSTTEDQYSQVDSKIRESLFPFQIDGVKFIIGRNGRCLLADDMGLGKTIQALGAVSYYRSEWPLLVICPSSVKLAWRDQIIKWISGDVKVTVINTSRDMTVYESCIADNNSVLLISYDVVSKLAAKLFKCNFKVIIMDESHFIKDVKSIRSKSCVPLLKKAKRVILLSGTPALSRPSEMFTQIDCVNPGIFNGNFFDYGNRYCNPKPTSWGTSYLGSTYMTELQVLLEEYIMIRRIKSDVLTQLPEKRREVIILAPELLKKATLKHQNQVDHFERLKGVDRHRELLKYFHETGKAKVDAIRSYIDDLIESPKKALFFAHHTEVLNAVEEELIKKKVGYIRIDGSVSAVQKRERAEKFQLDDKVQIAVLSIMAAGTGINLTSANLCIFGELFWNPGMLLQAEDRCHRIGQRDMVNIHYLVAENTADDFIWPLIQRKLKTLSKVGLNKENFKNSETTRFEESFSEKVTPKLSLMDYFEKDFIEETNDIIIDEGESNVEDKEEGILEKKENIPKKRIKITEKKTTVAKKKEQKEADESEKKTTVAKKKEQKETNESEKKITIANKKENIMKETIANVSEKKENINKEIVNQNGDKEMADVSFSSEPADWMDAFDDSYEVTKVDVDEEENFDWILDDEWSD